VNYLKINLLYHIYSYHYKPNKLHYSNPIPIRNYCTLEIFLEKQIFQFLATQIFGVISNISTQHEAIDRAFRCLLHGKLDSSLPKPLYEGRLLEGSPWGEHPSSEWREECIRQLPNVRFYY